MALQSFYGSAFSFVGPDPWLHTTVPAVNNTAIDAANEAVIAIGRVRTSDGGSHTIDTTGSSSIGWRSATVTFSNVGTTVKVGIAPVDTGAGPSGRASNATDVISFDVSKSMTGGGGGITANAYQTHIPDTGTKTIANGDLVAIAIQMTARGGADAVNVTSSALGSDLHRPLNVAFTGGSYNLPSAVPNFFITFSDGATGWIEGGEIFSTRLTRTWNSGGATKEYGQLYKLPFPAKIYGVYGWVDPDADFDVALYSDPLGTPVAEKTASIDANTVADTQGRRFRELFASPYTTTADQIICATYKPGGSNITAYYKTLASATHRASDVWGTQGYGISRASGAFADANSSLDHYYIGLIVGAFEHGVQPTYGLGI